MPVAQAPRRLSKQARYEQLVSAAMPILAEHGLSGFSLEEIGERAGVTRNLLYHYFPRGRPDLVLAVVDRAGRELTDGWVVDESVPLAERLEANFGRMACHALTPTDAWRIHRRARAGDQPEVNELVQRYADLMISSISRDHLGTDRPPRLVHLALSGYVAFAEAVLDQARVSRIPRVQVMRLLSDTLVSTIASARATAGKK